MVITEFVRDRNLEPDVADSLKSWSNSTHPSRHFTDYAAEHFEQQGWKLLGQGLYSVVLAKPESNFVIKISIINDTGFNRFVLMTHKYKNPHFPNITNVRRINIKGRIFFIYLIEKLHPIKMNIFYHKLLEFISLVVNGHSVEQLINKFNEGMFPQGDKIAEYLEKHPSMMEAINLIHKSPVNMKSSYDFDLHTNNFMQREDGTIVITDPYVELEDDN